MREPAGIARWPSAMTSRVTRASIRSSTRAVSLDSERSTCSPITADAGTTTSTNLGSGGAGITSGARDGVAGGSSLADVVAPLTSRDGWTAGAEGPAGESPFRAAVPGRTGASGRTAGLAAAGLGAADAVLDTVPGTEGRAAGSFLGSGRAEMAESGASAVGAVAGSAGVTSASVSVTGCAAVPSGRLGACATAADGVAVL